MTTWLITGAGRGIGLEMTKQLLAKGEVVVGSIRNPRQAERLQLELGVGFKPLIFDVTDAASVAAGAAALDMPIDVLVNNAGIIGPADHEQSIDQMNFDAFAETLQINTLGPLRVAQAFKTHLMKGNNPRLATISSQMGGMDSAKHDRIAYRASKSAVNKIVQAMATGWTDMCVVSLHPGWVQTDMGGTSADITPAESASGIINVLSGLTRKDTGKFLNWDGSERVW